MACHTLTESAKLANVSRRTIQRYIKSGKLSYKTNEHGNPEVETSELIRVFGELSHPIKQEVSQSVTVTENDISNVIENAVSKATQPLIEEIKKLQEEVQSLKRLTYIPSEETLQPQEKSQRPSNPELDDIPSLDDFLNGKI